MADNEVKFEKDEKKEWVIQLLTLFFPEVFPFSLFCLLAFSVRFHRKVAGGWLLVFEALLSVGNDTLNVKSSISSHLATSNKL